VRSLNPAQNAWNAWLFIDVRSFGDLHRPKEEKLERHHYEVLFDA
jgi:hypothetical protein